MTESTDWLSAFAILASGLILGALFIYTLRRKKGAADSGTMRVDLEAKRDLLLGQLHELDESGLFDIDERFRLERETADVLRALDRCDEPPVAVPVVVHRANPAMKGFLVGVASMIVIALLGYYGYTTATAKTPEAMPAPSNEAGMVGQPQGAPPQMPQGMSQGTQQLEERVRTDPDNVENRIALAKAYFNDDNLMGTFEQTRLALEKNPNEPRALTYNAIVRMAMGQNDDARKMLEAAAKIDPTFIDAWVALASAQTQLGNAKAANAAIESAIKQHPEEEARLREVFAQIKARPVTPPPPAAAAAHQAMNEALPEAARGNPWIHVTLSVGSAAKAKSGVVYVIARAEGASGGHPVAVKRINAAAFPLTVDLSDADSMMGQPFPSKVRVEARLDSDGDVGTNDPGDPKAFVEGVGAGSSLVLKLE